MDSREYINKPADSVSRGQGVSREAEDGIAALLKEALADDCPDPGGRIAAAVMAQIRAEQEAADKARRAAKADARRRSQGLFMKWGGMAACMVILCGVLVVAAPLMNRSDMAVQTADAAAAMQAETVPELLTADAAPAEGVAEAYSDEEVEKYTYTAAGEVTEEAALTKSAPVKQTCTAEEETVQTEEALADTVLMFAVRSTAEDAAVEETADPETENQLYLTALLESGQLTESVYAAWMTENGYDAVTDWTIEELRTAFGFAE